MVKMMLGVRSHVRQGPEETCVKRGVVIATVVLAQGRLEAHTEKAAWLRSAATISERDAQCEDRQCHAGVS
jgi:hypothetical protein